VTDGEDANGAKTFSFSGIITTKTGAQFQFTPTVTTSVAAQGGAEIESVSSIKYSAPKTFAAQDRAVTSDDYASIVRKVYPATSDIITFGGEQDDPPEFGKVKIAIKPRVGNNISSFTKQEIFFNEWKKKYDDSIEWISKKDGGKVVNVKNGVVSTETGLKFSPDFLHIIPNQQASEIFHNSGLTSDDWCLINPVNFEIVDCKDIYALGDSIDAGDMPKSSFSANSQAKMLSMNLVNKILNKDYVDPVFLNTCYSFSSGDRAFSITSWYRLNSQKNRIISLGSKESDVDASDLDRLRESKEAYDWYENITGMIYG